MKTLEQAWDIIENVNSEAYRMAYDSWLEADAAIDDENEEELREEASEEQQAYFRDEYDNLDDESKEVIQYWLKNDADFKEQFETYYGEEL